MDAEISEAYHGSQIVSERDISTHRWQRLEMSLFIIGTTRSGIAHRLHVITISGSSVKTLKP